MTALLLETALLLLVAYFVGAFVGCLMRRTFFAGAVAEPVDYHAGAPAVQVAVPFEAPSPPQRLSDHEPIRPKIESIPAAPEVTRHAVPPADSADLEAATERFQRSLTSHSDDYIYPQATAEQSAPEPAPPSPPPTPPAPVTPVAKAKEPPAPVPAPPSPPPTPPAPATPVAKAAEPPAPQPKAPAPVAAAPSGTTAATAAAVAALAAGGSSRARTEEAVKEPAGAPKQPPAVEPAATPATVTVPASPPAVSVTKAPAAPVDAPAAKGAPVTKEASVDDLTRIRAIDVGLQEKLRQAGVRRFADIAGWSPDDVRRISEAFGFKGRIEHENWIEQAQILASGAQTAFARQGLGAGQKLAKPSADEGESRKPVTGARSPTSATVTGIGAAIAASVAALPPRRPALALGRDNLQRISQINEEVERLLNVQGVSRYDQIAHWTRADVTRFERLLGNDGRISRENWIEQAHVLARGEQTAYARAFDSKAALTAAEPRRPTQLAEAIRTAGHADATAAKKVDLTSLRSVRSEAFRSGDTQPLAATVGGPTPPVRPDDLKRIRGVGVLIEKRLNAMGVWRYEQVANWTSADIDRISQALEFRGRIERENWVEQARILASGGQTEFARRVDRGEVETSRAKT